MQNAHFDYSSTHIEPPNDIADDVITWGREHITDDEIFVSLQDFTYGREDEIHITILNGIHSEKTDQLVMLLRGETPLHVQLGEVRVFSNAPKYDVLIIEVFSSDLIKLNKKLAKKIPFTEKYASYNPHLTIAYVKKGKGWRHNGLDRWKGSTFVTNQIVFSSKNGIKEYIIL